MTQRTGKPLIRFEASLYTMDDSIILRPLHELEDLAGIQAGKMMLVEALFELDALRKQDRY